MNDLETKYKKLREIIRNYGSLLVAFSGGVDSTFLAKAAHDLLGERSLAVTVCSDMHPGRELKDAVKLAKEIGFKHRIIKVDMTDIPEISGNPAERCYYCKRSIFKMLKNMSAEINMDFVADGSNTDDEGDFRPGRKAIKELGIVSPLKGSGMTKENIRELSRSLGLSTWNKPPLACLATRIPYGKKLTKEKLRMIDLAEEYIVGLGFDQVRVRYYEGTAKIEVEKDNVAKLLIDGIWAGTVKELRQIGFKNVTVDPEGYRTGSMNINLEAEKVKN